MISVVIPLYNKEQSIGHTVEAVLRQTYQDFEIVIVDDGSTDGSLQAAKSVSDPRIRIVTQTNAGVSAARNRGIAEAKGEFVAFLDADDEWLPDYLATQHYLTEKYKDCDVFATDYFFKKLDDQPTNTVLRRIIIADGEDGILDNYFEVASNSHPPLWTSAVMARKSALESVGGFPVGIKSGEDLLTWARLACRYKIAYSRIQYAIYNLGDGYNMSNLPARKQDAGDPVGKELKKLYAEHKTKRGFREYLSHWHKMRASVAIRYGEKAETLKEVAKSLKYHPLNYKVMMFIPLVFIPKAFRNKIISLWR